MMDLDQAKGLRAELEAIEATMQRIKALWNSPDFPSPDDLEDLDRSTGAIRATMEGIIGKQEEMPSENDFVDLCDQLDGIRATMEGVIGKQEEMPVES